MANSYDFRMIPGAVETYVNSSAEARAYMGWVGRQVRDEARGNARSISQKTDAIVSQVGSDTYGIYADIGYSRHHPGFFLWWYEVGTVRHGPRPHLRPALRPGLLGA